MESFFNVKNIKSPKEMTESFLGIIKFKKVMVPLFQY